MRIETVSPISARRFFSDWGIRVLLSEAVWVGIPSLGLILWGTLRNRK